jgi:hypothetical protein
MGRKGTVNLTSQKTQPSICNRTNHFGSPDDNDQVLMRQQSQFQLPVPRWESRFHHSVLPASSPRDETFKSAKRSVFSRPSESLPRTSQWGDIAEAQGEARVEPDAMTNDLGGKTVTISV